MKSRNYFLVIIILFALFGVRNKVFAMGGGNASAPFLAGNNDSGGFLYPAVLYLSDTSFQAYKASIDVNVTRIYSSANNLIIEMCLSSDGSWGTSSDNCWTLFNQNVVLTGFLGSFGQELFLPSTSPYTMALFHIRGGEVEVSTTIKVFGRKVYIDPFQAPPSAQANSSFDFVWNVTDTNSSPTLTAPAYCTPRSGTVTVPNNAGTTCTPPTSGGTADFTVTANGPGSPSPTTRSLSIPIGGSGTIRVTSNYDSWFNMSNGSSTTMRGHAYPNNDWVTTGAPAGTYSMSPDYVNCYSPPTITSVPSDMSLAPGGTLTVTLNYTNGCSTPTPQPPSGTTYCYPASQQIAPGGTVNFTTSGGYGGSYQWTASPGTVGTDYTITGGSTTSPNVSAQFNTAGSYVVTITHGYSGNCNITVSAASTPPGPTYTPSGGANIGCSTNGGASYTTNCTTTPGATVRIDWTCSGTYTWFGWVTDNFGNRWDNNNPFAPPYSGTFNVAVPNTNVFSAHCQDNNLSMNDPNYQVNASSVVTVATPPPTVNLTVSKDNGTTWSKGPLTITAGQPILAQWTSSANNYCTTSWQAGNRPVNSASPDTVTLNVTTTLTLNCYSLNGTSNQDTALVNVTTVTTPSNLSADNVSDCPHIILNWAYTATDNSGFIIYRSTTSGAEVQIAQINTPSTRTYNDTTTTLNTRYYYYVTAYTGTTTSQSLPSNEVNILAPQCVSNLTNSAKTLFKVNGATPTSSFLNSGDKLTFQVTISNSGTANATINYICDYPSANFTNITNLGGGHGTTITQNSATCNGNPKLNVSGTLPGSTNWVITYDATYTNTSASAYDICTNTASVNLTDASGTQNKIIKYGPMFCRAGNIQFPTIKEVAP
jgi:hypothetical protein